MCNSNQIPRYYAISPTNSSPTDISPIAQANDISPIEPEAVHPNLLRPTNSIKIPPSNAS